MMIDIHTHILPNMDDGSKSVSESLQMLDMLEKQNVKLVCLTSHFYPSHESIEDYLERRNKAFELLNYSGPIKLLLGAEVHYYRGILASNNLKSLCIEGTNLLLLELPFEIKLNEAILEDIINLQTKGIRVILAHTERYNIELRELKYLRSNGIYIQSNNEFIKGGLFNHKGIKMLKEGYIDFLGSDCHNLSDRKPNNDIITKVLDKDFLQAFTLKNDKILNND